MAAGFDLGSIFSTLDLDFSGFLKGIEQARSAVKDLQKDIQTLRDVTKRAFDSMGDAADTAAQRMRSSMGQSASGAVDDAARAADAMATAYATAAQRAAQGAANAAAEASNAVIQAVAQTRATSAIVPFTYQATPIGPYAPPELPSIQIPVGYLPPAPIEGQIVRPALPPGAPLALPGPSRLALPPGGGFGTGGGAFLPAPPIALLPQYAASLQNVAGAAGQAAGAFTGFNYSFQGLAGLTTNSTAALNALTAQVRNAPTAWQAMGQAAQGAWTSVGGFLQQASTQFTSLQQSLLSFRTLLLGFGAIKGISIIADFDQQMAQLRAVAEQNKGFSEPGFQQMRQQALALGATTIFSPTQAAEGMKELAQAGFEVNEVLQMIGPTLQMASIEHMNLGNATKIVAALLRQFGLDVSQTQNVIDMFTKASAISATSVTIMGESLKQVGPLAAEAGLSVQETLAALATASQKNVMGPQAGTGLRAVLAGLLQDVPKHERVLKDMGLSLDDVDPHIVGFAQAMRTLGEHGLDASRAFALFRANAANFAVAVVRNVDVLDEFNRQLANAAGTTSQMATTATNNLKDAFTQLWNVLQVATIQLGDSGVSGGLRSLVDGLTNALRALTGFIDPLSTAAPTAYALAAALQGLLVVLTGLAGIKLITLFGGFIAASPQLAALALAIGAIVTVYGLMTGESQRFAQAQANVNSLIQRMGVVTAETSKAVIDGLRKETEAMIAKERVALAALMPPPEGFTTAERPLLGTGMKLPFGVEVPGLQTYNEDAAAQRAAMASDPRVKQIQDNITRMEAAAAGMPTGVVLPKPGEQPYNPYRDTEGATNKALLRLYETAKKAADDLIRSNKELLQLDRTQNEIAEARVQGTKEEVRLAELKAANKQKELGDEEALNTLAMERYKIVLAAAQALPQLRDPAGTLIKNPQVQAAEDKLEDLRNTQRELVFKKDLARVQGQMAIDTARETLERTKQVDALSRMRDLQGQTLSFQQAQQGQAQGYREQATSYAEEMMRRGGGSDIALEAFRQAAQYDNTMKQYEAEVALHDAKQAHLAEELAAIEQQRAEIGENWERAKELDTALDQKRREFAQGTLLRPIQPPLAKPQTAEELRALQIAGAFKDGINDLVAAFAQGGDAIGKAIQNMGQKIIETALKPLFDQMQAGLAKLITGMGDWGPWLAAGVGVALTAIGAIFNKQKADVTSLGDQAKHNIESVEKTKGLIAGQSEIAVQKLSENLGQAMRPTVEQLVGIRGVLERIAIQLGVPESAAASPNSYYLTNQMYASELIGSARLS